MTIEKTSKPAPISRRRLIAGAASLGVALSVAPAPAAAKTAAEIDAGVQQALKLLFTVSPELRSVYDRADAVLVVPEIVKAGFIIGGAYGEGALLTAAGTESYWSYGSASIGFQAGVQRTRQVLFFMTTKALEDFREGAGLELGADAELTLIDAGAEVAIDTTKDTKPVIAVVYNRQGLLGGASLQGGKYSRIDP